MPTQRQYGTSQPHLRRTAIPAMGEPQQRRSSAADFKSTRIKVDRADKWLWLFAVFVLCVALTGGASRYDVLSLAPLRFVSAVVLAITVWGSTWAEVKRVWVPLSMIFTIALTMGLQLVPLPPSIWSDLPGRALIHEIDGLLGMEDLWRPITFSSAKTYNSLASLVVPLAALGLMARLDTHSMKRVPWIFVAVGCLSALIGIAQVVFEDASNLYFYALTNRGEAVGLFANRNHNAVFLACCFLICLLRITTLKGDRAASLWIALAAAMALLVGAIMVNSSRAGLLSLALALLVFGVSQAVGRPHLNQASGTLSKGTVWVLAPFVLVAAALALVGAFIALERSAAFSRILEQDAVADMRVRLLPEVVDMTLQFQPWGVGFGAFEQAYRTIEPEHLLMRSYVNHAHNDWLQFIIEGGIAGAAILLVMIVLSLRRASRVARADHESVPMRRDAGVALGVMFILGVASLLDYPVRTPTMMVLGIWCLAALFHPAAASGALSQVAKERPLA